MTAEHAPDPAPGASTTTVDGAGAGPAGPAGPAERNEEELQYLALCRTIIDTGHFRPDRTGTGTLSLFGPPQLRFSLRDKRFPLLTTKRVFTKAVIHELLWFVSGCTDANVLRAAGVHIWDGNGSREFLDKVGLSHRAEGDLGPVYGFQWRHFGAPYVDFRTDYTGQGVDQLADVIHKIKNTPYDRRIIMSAWNPADLGQMALPPCHMFCQFYVDMVPGKRPELSCLMYQRSCDMGLGVPFNIASYALLTRMIAEVCDMDAGDFIHTMGDAHVYRDHIEPLREQLARDPREFPTLEIRRRVDDIDGFEYSDFEIVGYRPHAKIDMRMSV
ncbi:thymidylate synthase/dCMP hydroxymethylase domain-containing protein [Dipodascopsis tothii]|uniref:thymidylate synthase/dCMP hydroxymethylase domain-containing protein n=1 Tax=Dipodascopsis tothii TaxID=44089 RepID=UPI0034CF9C90